MLYSGGVDRTVRGWDLVGGREAWRGWCGGGVGALAAAHGVSGDQRMLLAAAGAAVRLFDTRSRTPLTTLWSSGATGACPAARGVGGVGGEVAVTALALGPSHRLYTAAGDKLRLWDLRMLECVCKAWSGHAAAVMCLALGHSEGGDLIVTGSKDHYVRTLDMQPQETGSWEAANRRLLEPPHYDGVQALALCGDVLYSASRDTSIKRWSLADNTLTHTTMNAHKGWVTGVCAVGAVRDAGEGEPLVASCGRDAALRVWGARLRPVAHAALPDAAHALAPHHDATVPALYTAAAATCERGGSSSSERDSQRRTRSLLPTAKREVTIGGGRSEHARSARRRRTRLAYCIARIIHITRSDYLPCGAFCNITLGNYVARVAFYIICSDYATYDAFFNITCSNYPAYDARSAYVPHSARNDTAHSSCLEVTATISGAGYNYQHLHIFTPTLRYLHVSSTCKKGRCTRAHG